MVATGEQPGPRIKPLTRPRKRGNSTLKHGRRTAAAIAARKEHAAKTRQMRRELKGCILALQGWDGEQLTTREQESALEYLERLEKID